NKIVQRYQEMAEELSLNEEVMVAIESHLEQSAAGDKTHPDYYIDAFKASGEDNNAKLVAAYFNQIGIPASYVSPKEAGLLVTNEPHNARLLPDSYEKLITLREREEVVVFPGFFGYTHEGDICTFSR